MRLIDEVIEELKENFSNNDYTVLEELLEYLPEDKLLQSLPEEKSKKYSINLINNQNSI